MMWLYGRMPNGHTWRKLYSDTTACKLLRIARHMYPTVTWWVTDT